MSKRIGIDVKRAGSVGDREVPVVVIHIEGEMPELGKMSLAEFDMIFQSDAQAIEMGLRMALPGGTYDRLLVFMLQHKASHFRVPWAEPEQDKT